VARVPATTDCALKLARTSRDLYQENLAKTALARGQGPVKLVVLTVVLMTGGCAAAQTAPSPRPNPSSPRSEAAGEGVTPRGPPTPTACQLRLTPDRAMFQSLGAIAGPGECGGPDIVSLQRVITKDHLSVEISPTATLRCEMAEAIVDWVREDLVSRATVLGSVLAGIESFDSFECRGQNRVVGAKMSEHGRANALDIRAIRLKSGRVVRPTDPGVAEDFRVAMRTSVCTRFTTVLGPGSDGFHEDHIHVDLAERHSGYRICQWDVRDPSPEVGDALRSAASAIPFPRQRPPAGR
jgi:hypothetical protein